jgi:hypothetical protein
VPSATLYGGLCSVHSSGKEYPSDIDSLILRKNRGCEKNALNSRPTCLQRPPPNFAGDYIEVSIQIA